MNKVALLLIFFVIGKSPLLAKRKCSKKVVCIISQKKGSSIEYSLEKLATFDITVTITLNLKNMVSSKGKRIIVNLRKIGKKKIFTIKPKDIHKAYSYGFRYSWTYGNYKAKHDDSVIYTLPFSPKKFFTLTQGYFGKFTHFGPQSYALDFTMPIGTKIYAARGGIVTGIRQKFKKGGTTNYYKDKGNFIMIRHNDDTVGHYEHIMFQGAKVKLGQLVKKGDLIALSGDTGYSSGPHLHFMVYTAQGKRSYTSIPTKFKVLGFPLGTKLIQGNSYGLDDSAPKFGKIKTCKKLIKLKATGCRKSFQENESFYVIVNILRPNKYKLNITISKPNSNILPSSVKIKTNKSWSIAYFDFNPSNQPSAIGLWKLSLNVNGVEIGSKEITITK